MSSSRAAIKDFRFEGEDGKAQEIEAVVPIETYLVKYRDAEGKTQVRVAFKVTGDDNTRVLQHSIHGSQVATPATGWFVTQLKEKIGETEAGAESI